MELDKGTEEIIKKLRDPLPPTELEWRVGMKTKDGKKAMILPYINARAVMKRLDTVLGPLNWYDSYYEIVGGMGCKLSVRLGGDWYTKEDATDLDKAGENTVKGGVSDALKRAAVKWGIGRYLYYLPKYWVELDQTGKFTPPTLPGWAQPPAKKDDVPA